MFDSQEYIRRQLEEEQRHLEILQQQLLHEQAMLLVSVWLPCLNHIYIFFPHENIEILKNGPYPSPYIHPPCLFSNRFFCLSPLPLLICSLNIIPSVIESQWLFFFNVSITSRLLNFIMQVLIIPPLHKLSCFSFPSNGNRSSFWIRLTVFVHLRGAINSWGQNIISLLRFISRDVYWASQRWWCHPTGRGGLYDSMFFCFYF